MKLSIVILNYNTYEMTLKLIKNIEDIYSKKSSIEIIVVDNASSNESAEVLKEKSNDSRRFIFLKNKNNSGYAAGNNVGIRYALNNGADYVLISNNDIEIESADCINRMIQLMELNGNIGVVSPRIISKNGKKDPPLYFEKPSLWDMTFGIINSHKKRFRIDENVNRRIYAPRGSFMLLRAIDIKNVNYLDEGTFLYYEEPILAERLHKINKECWLCAESVVIHNHGKTISNTLQKKNTCKILCKSYGYYLKEYRNYNWLIRTICIKVRECSYMIRR